MNSRAKCSPEIFAVPLDFVKFAIEKVGSHTQVVLNILKSFPITEFEYQFLNLNWCKFQKWLQDSAGLIDADATQAQRPFWEGPSQMSVQVPSVPFLPITGCRWLSRLLIPYEDHLLDFGESESGAAPEINIMCCICLYNFRYTDKCYE